MTAANQKALPMQGGYYNLSVCQDAQGRNLNVYQDGEGRNLMDWIHEKGENFYKDVGRRTWRVPPLKFNTQKLHEQKLNKLQNGAQNIRLEAPILEPPNVTDQETNTAENVVCAAFENLSNFLVNNRQGSAMFLISNFEYDNYLNKLSHLVTQSSTPKEQSSDSGSECPCWAPSSLRLPRDVTSRGELDILILQQEAGIVLVQTKAVGYNFGQPSQFDRSLSIQTAVVKAGEQLARDRSVMTYIFEDLKLRDDQITTIIALPNLPRKVLMEEMSPDLKKRVSSEFKLSLETSFLCEEEFQPGIDGNHSSLQVWWTRCLLKSAKGINLDMMQKIAFRTVGLLSTVSVWSYAQPRIEVRNWNEAAWETGNRYTQVVLSPQQVELLKHEDQYLYLWGPAGSGKTLLLSLKGRQWLRRDCNVAILNTRLGSRGRTVGQVIETTINKSEGLKKTAVRIDLDLMESEEVLSGIVAKSVGDRVYHFLLDEVAWVKETDKLLSVLKQMYPDSAIWCAGMLEECQPEGFESGKLQVILRCPPSVQRVLRLVDNRPERCDLYKLDSAKAGLPTNGLPAHFIIHSQHGDSSTQPYDCSICARELSEYLLNHLNLTSDKFPNKMLPVSEISKRQTVTESFGKEMMNTSPKFDFGSSVGSDSGCDVRFPEPEAATSNTADQVKNKNKKKKKRKKPCNNENKPEKDVSSPNISTPAADVKNENNSELITNKSTNAAHEERNKSSQKSKCGKKKKGTESSGHDPSASHQQELKFSDAILPVTVPRAWHHYNKRGYWSISREALAQEMILLGSRAFGQELYKSGVPLKVEEAMVMNAEGKLLENNFVICPVGAVHGLEYKIVVCVPSACALPEYTEISLGIKNGQMEPWGLLRRTQFGTSYLQRKEELERQPYSLSGLPGSCQPQIDKIRISTHVAEEGAPYDYLYEPVSEGEVHLVPEEDLSQLHTETAECRKQPYVPPVYSDSFIKKIKAELCGFCDDKNWKDKCVCQHFKPEQLAAIHRLDAWDKAYVLMCASRCTSVLVLVLP